MGERSTFSVAELTIIKYTQLYQQSKILPTNTTETFNVSKVSNVYKIIS